MISVLLSPQERELISLLAQQNAKVVTWPIPQIQAAEDHSALDEAIENLFGYDWLILKNEHAAEYFVKRLLFLNRRANELDNLKVVAIGEATQEKLIEASIHTDIVLSQFSLAKVFESVTSYAGDQASLAGLNFLLPSAGICDESFEAELRDAGARVDNIVAYRTTAEARRLGELKAYLIGGGVDFLTVTRCSTLADLATLFDTDDLSRLIGEAEVIGGDEDTQRAATQFDLNRILVSPKPTPAAIVRVIISLDREAPDAASS